MTRNIRELNSLIDSLFRVEVAVDSAEYDADVVTAADGKSVLSEFPVDLEEHIEPLAVINHVVDPNSLVPTAVSNITETLYASGTPGTTAELFAYRVPNTGGHYHGGSTRDSAAIGLFSPRNFSFGDNYPQNIPVTHTLPDVSGEIRVALQGSDGDFYAGIISIAFADGFVQVSQTKNLRLKAPTRTHRKPYWVTPAMRAALNKLADGYARRTKKKYITITDASLEHGGLFDHCATWHPPHKRHRDGRTVDIRNRDQNDQQRKVFVSEAKKAGIGASDHGNHWHVRLL